MIDAAWREAREILIVRLDNLGDVLVTTPAIRCLRLCRPDARLTLLAGPVGAQVGRLNPDLDDVIVYQAPWMDPWRQLPQDSEREQAAIAALRERAFDGAVIFTSFRQSPLPAAYLCYLADIPLRLAASIDGPGSLLTTRHKHPECMMHEVERGLDLLGAIGCHLPEGMEARDVGLVLAVPARAREELTDGSTTAGLIAMRQAGRPLVVVHPGCSMPARTYPWELYVEVVDGLTERLGAIVALTGAADERVLVERIHGRLGPTARRAAVPLAGELPFAVFCALIEAADVTITNNTGPMHIAAAAQTPVVALFALTNPPEQWGPWQVAHRQLYHEVPCRICYSRVCPYEHECLRLVAPASVVEAASELSAFSYQPSAKAGGRPRVRGKAPGSAGVPPALPGQAAGPYG